MVYRKGGYLVVNLVSCKKISDTYVEIDTDLKMFILNVPMVNLHCT